jgi:hypothetical protein
VGLAEREQQDEVAAWMTALLVEQQAEAERKQDKRTSRQGDKQT